MFEFSIFDTLSLRTLPSFGHFRNPMNTNVFNILWFSCQRNSRDIVYQRTCWFSWFIVVRHGLFEILLTVYSALSRSTNHGIYYITRRGIWLLTIFHIPYIHFQRELRKVTPPKLYLSVYLFPRWNLFSFHACSVNWLFFELGGGGYFDQETNFLSHAGESL